MNKSVALISMPWMRIHMPSIQLAVIASDLKKYGISSKTYELYLDYARRIGPDLYDQISSMEGFFEEWVFARHYYLREEGKGLDSFLDHIPSLNIGQPQEEQEILKNIGEITDDFIIEIAANPLWSDHDIVGITNTIHQTASSMAMARALKHYHPHLTIVCGGSGCSGVMGEALLEICPYIDFVISGTAEGVFAQLVTNIRNHVSNRPTPGVLRRTSSQTSELPDEADISNRELVVPLMDLAPLIEYDSFFERVNRLGLSDIVKIWLPFQSSRGCWWGEKNKCRFCGLSDDMKYTVHNWERCLEQLHFFESRYSIKQFYAVDLIIPAGFFETFLPAIKAENAGWKLFYEVRSHLSKEHVKLLADAGVTWIQPGIESLSSSVLKLMRKGVTATDNIQLLKWCKEYGIHPSWNIITGIPGETGNEYDKIPLNRLHHLMPPTGVSPFALHRFSSYQENPNDFQITNEGPHHLYKHIFPVSNVKLSRLVYLFDYSTPNKERALVYTRSLRTHINEWRKAFQCEVDLTMEEDGDGLKIIDTRSEELEVHYLDKDDATLYSFLDRAIVAKNLDADFQKAHPHTYERITSSSTIAEIILYWIEWGLVLEIDSKIIALAISPTHLNSKACTNN